MVIQRDIGELRTAVGIAQGVDALDIGGQELVNRDFPARARLDPGGFQPQAGSIRHAPERNQHGIRLQLVHLALALVDDSGALLVLADRMHRSRTDDHGSGVFQT